MTAAERGRVKGERAKEANVIEAEMVDFIRANLAKGSDVVHPRGRGLGKFDANVTTGSGLPLYAEGKYTNKVNQTEKLDLIGGRLRKRGIPSLWLVWLSSHDAEDRALWRKSVLAEQKDSILPLALRYVFIDPSVRLEDTITYEIVNKALVERELLGEYIRSTTEQKV